MECNFRNLWPFAATSLIAATSLVHAGYEEKGKPMPINNLTPTLTLQHAEGVTLDGAVLLLQAHADGLGFAIKPRSEDLSLLSKRSGDIKHPEQQFNWGMRVSMGYTLPNNGWGFSADYTRMHNLAKGVASASFNGTLADIAIGDFAPDLALALTPTKAKSHFTVHLNQVDLQAGRSFHLNSWMCFRPHFGLKTVWLDRKLKVSETGGNIGAADEYERLARNRFFGIGPMAGMDAIFHMGVGLSFFATSDISIPYGFLDDHGRLQLETNSITGKTKTLLRRNHDSFRTAKFVTDMQVGVGYDALLWDRYHIGLRTGWENHLFVNQQEEKEILRGDISMQGWMLSMRFDF